MEIEVSLAYDEIKPDIDEAYNEERKKITVPGFRKGKVPNHILKKLYSEAIEYQACEKIANKKFWEIVDAEGLKPISAPQLTDLDFKPNEKFTFKISYEIIPQLELKDYKGLEIIKPKLEVKEEDIEAQWKAILKSKATREVAEIVSDINHIIKVNLQRLDENGTEMENSQSKNLSIDLSDSKVNPEIISSVLQKKVGDNFTFTFTDEHSHGDHVHKETFNYKGEILSIEKIVYPELTEETILAVTNNKFKTELEYKADLRKNFEEYYNSEAENIFINSLLNQIIKNNDFEAPKGYVENYKKRLIESEREEYKKYNMPFDEKKSSEQLSAKAEWNAKWQIIMDNIIRIENIKVEDSELEELAKQEAEKTGISVQKLIKYYKDSHRDEVLLEDKVIDFLKKNTKIKEINPNEVKEEKTEKKSKGNK
jgi:trigger factor